MARATISSTLPLTSCNVVMRTSNGSSDDCTALAETFPRIVRRRENTRVTSIAIYFSGATVTFNPSLYPPLDECYLTLIVCFHNDNGTFSLRPASSSCFHPTRGFKLRCTRQSSDETSSGMSPAIRLRGYIFIVHLPTTSGSGSVDLRYLLASSL